MVIASVVARGTGSRSFTAVDRARQRRLRFDRPLIRVNSGSSFVKIAPIKFNPAFFCARISRSRSGLLPARSPDRGYCLSDSQSAQRRAAFAGRKVVRFGANMSGVIGTMRRTLLSCTSLARNGLIALATAAFAAIAPAHAGDSSPLDAISASLDLNRQEFAVLTTALALLGFSVVSAILLMRTRVRAARSEARLRADIGELQVQADRFRALLFAEPQILISWAAGDNRPEITGDISLLMPQDSHAAAPARLRNLAAAGTGAADGPRGRRAARGRRRFSAQPVDLERTLDRSHGPRHRRPGHCTDSRTRRRAPGTGGIEPALQDACRRKPSCCATSPPPCHGRSGPRARKASFAMPTRPTPRPPRPPASRTRSIATSNCSKATSATKSTGR